MELDRDALGAMAEELQASESEKDKEIGGRVRRVLEAPAAQLHEQLQRLFSYHDCTWYVNHLEARARTMEHVADGITQPLQRLRRDPESPDRDRAARYRQYAERIRELQTSGSEA